ncbi:MAG: hypothetical protein O6852_04250 [Gammaproteobacteria bacterium]|nr:hypothetical protein [Gammaproteobacteria bacterium]
MKTYYSLITVILILLPAISVQGFGGGKGYVSGNFWGADLDRNEQLSHGEAKAVYNLADKEVFDRYDQNGNGSINFTEFSYFMQQSPWIKKFVHPSVQ